MLNNRELLEGLSLEEEIIEKELYEVMGNLDVPIPCDLDDQIAQRIKALPRKNIRWVYDSLKVVAGFVGVIFILSILIYSNESFASMSMKVPGLKVLASILLPEMMGFKMLLIMDIL